MLRFVLPLAITAFAAGVVAAPKGAKSFAISIEVPESTEVGRASSARVKLEPGAGYKVNKQYPIKLVVSAPADVEVERKTLRAPDAVRLDEEQALFEVKFMAKEKGRKEVKAVFGFSVCTPKNCEVKKEQLTFSTEVR